MRENLLVSCYDSMLHLLWDKQLAHSLHDIPELMKHYTVRDVAVHSIPLSITADSEGLIVVGVSMVAKSAQSPEREQLEQVFAGATDAQVRNLNVQAMLERFTVYALNASNGHVLWRHDGADARPEQFVRSLPQHAQKLDLMRELSLRSYVTAGVNDWTVFKQSLMSELPHIWSELQDSSIRIAHFVRRHLGAGASNQIDKGGKTNGREDSSTHLQTKTDDAKKDKPNLARRLNFDLGRFTGVDSPRLSLSASLPHDALEHTENPNVLVAHTNRGLEVISLRTGASIASLSLAKDRTYVDLDGDGVIDSLTVLESPSDVTSESFTQLHNNERLQHCMLVATSGLPAISQLFNGTICQTRRHLHDPVRRFNSALPTTISATRPVVYQSVDPGTLQVSKYSDVAVAINTGMVTSYSGSGAFKWQLDNAPTWPVDFPHRFIGLIDTDAHRVDEIGGPDKLKSKLLVVGKDDFAMVSSLGGLLAFAHLPNPVIAYPVVGDFDNDGITDVIIITQSAILGFRLEVTESTRILFILLCILSVVAAFCFVLNIRRPELVSSSQSPDVFSTTKALQSKYKKNVLALMRSTDDYHIE